MNNIVLTMMMSFGERDSKKIELAVWGSIREMQATQICPRTLLPPRGPRFIGACPGGACLLFPWWCTMVLVYYFPTHLSPTFSLVLSSFFWWQLPSVNLPKGWTRLSTMVWYQTAPDSSSDYPGFFKDHTCGTDKQGLTQVLSKVYDLLCEIGCIMQLYSSS